MLEAQCSKCDDLFRLKEAVTFKLDWALGAAVWNKDIQFLPFTKLGVLISHLKA